MLIDTHCHLSFPELASQADAVIARAELRGVDRNRERGLHALLKENADI